MDKKKILFHGVLPDFSRMLEGSLEKQVRQTGEWLVNYSEERIRSSSYNTLKPFSSSSPFVFFSWFDEVLIGLQEREC